MSNYGNYYGVPADKSYESGVVPVWLEVKERKVAGGTVDLTGVAAGTLIPPGIPVSLKTMGGEAKFLETYTVEEAVTAEGTSLKIKPLNGIVPKAGMIVGKCDADGKAAKAVALRGTPSVSNGVYTFTIAAGDLGELSKGDKLYIVSVVGGNKVAVLPDGLSWRQIHVEAEGGKGTVAVVTKGQILGDRISAVPDFYKAAMPGITFEYETA